MDWLTHHIGAPDLVYQQAAETRQQHLTKPAQSLGDLEALAIRLAALQQSHTPRIETIHISLFAADHGIAHQGVSAFPQAVTAEMVKNFVAGGAAINVLAQQHHAHLEIIDVGVASDLSTLAIIHQKIKHGSADFSTHAAMSTTELSQALNIGRQAIQRAQETQCQLFIAGEMGIANTTSATAIACQLLNIKAKQLTGAGTGIDLSTQCHKAALIQRALNKHRAALNSPLKVLQYLGGFEIAALTGAYLSAAQQGIVVLVDGFICSVAALLAARLNPAIKPWLFYAHCSHEQGHQRILDALQAEPLLHLKLRLGEASGAALAIPLMQSACLLHNKMATFSQAHISEKIQ